MKISELIEQLGELQGECGDLEVGIFEDGGPWMPFKTVTKIFPKMLDDPPKYKVSVDT
jgi:hypothetical protein